MTSTRTPIFPPWVDTLIKLLGAGAAVSGLYVVLMIYFSSQHTVLFFRYYCEPHAIVNFFGIHSCPVWTVEEYEEVTIRQLHRTSKTPLEEQVAPAPEVPNLPTVQLDSAVPRDPVARSGDQGPRHATNAHILEEAAHAFLLNLGDL